MNIIKTVTCHSGARDGYHLSAALHQIGALEKLVTDLYAPTIIGKWFPRRYNKHLPSSKTLSVWKNFLIEKLHSENFLVTDKILSNKAFELAERNKSNLFLTSYTAFEAFNSAINFNLNISRLLFQIHPHPLTIRRILTEELIYSPEAEFSIRAEHEMIANAEMLHRLDQESQLATSILVASQFTKNSLVENGIDSKKISILPYGVDSDRFPAKSNYNLQSGSLKILFLGQMVQRKGLSYLLKSLKALQNKRFELTIVGRGRIDYELLAEYESFVDFKVVTGLSHKDLVDCFHSHDVLVLPSLIEGFGHVILEAMCSGLPVICTKNTAGTDLFITGNEGFIVPIRDSDIIASTLEELSKDKSKLKFMGKSAATTARSFTWKNHVKGIQDFYIQHSKN